MELKEFQGLALRTESQIDDIKIDRHYLAQLLRIVVATSELLDGIKKGVFYNKTAKLDDNSKVYLRDIVRATKSLNSGFEGFDKPSTALFANRLPLDNIDPRMFHGLLGILTEAGELGAALLKAVDDENHSIDAVNVQEEMSDIAWYEAIIHDTANLDWGQGLTNVIEKLRIRYPDKYSDYNADNRNLEAERAALEVGVITPEEQARINTFKPVAGDKSTPIECSGGRSVNLSTGEYSMTVDDVSSTGFLTPEDLSALRSERGYRNADSPWPVHTAANPPPADLGKTMQAFISAPLGEPLSKQKWSELYEQNWCACGKNTSCECKAP